MCTSKEAEYWGLGSGSRNSKPFATHLNVLGLFTVRWKLWVYFNCTMAKRFVNEFSKSPFTVEVKNWNIFLSLLLSGVMVETVKNSSKNLYHVCIKLIKVVRKKISRAKHLRDIFSKNMHHFLIEINWFLFLFICYTRSKRKQKMEKLVARRPNMLIKPSQLQFRRPWLITLKPRPC